MWAAIWMLRAVASTSPSLPARCPVVDQQQVGTGASRPVRTPLGIDQVARLAVGAFGQRDREMVADAFVELELGGEPQGYGGVAALIGDAGLGHPDCRVVVGLVPTISRGTLPARVLACEILEPSPEGEHTTATSLRSRHHHHLAALGTPRSLLGDFGQIGLDALEAPSHQILVRHLAARERGGARRPCRLPRRSRHRLHLHLAEIVPRPMPGRAILADLDRAHFLRASATFFCSRNERP